MIKLKDNKKGTILLRDVMFMMFTFAGIIALAGILVSEMGNEYDNDAMVSSYNYDTMGSDTLENNASVWEGIAEDLSGENGIIQMVDGGLDAIFQILKEVIKAPATFANMITSTLDIIGVSDELQDVAGFILSAILYIIIIFGIVKVFLKGGDI